MRHETQISAFVSDSTREQLDRYVEEHGLKKGRLVEEALLHHLQALREIPRDVIVPARIVVTRGSGARVLARLTRPRKPTTSMKRLFAKRRE